MFTVELDDFDLFMLRHSLDVRKVVDGYLDEKTVGGDNPTDDIILERARTMQSFIHYMLRKRGVNASAHSGEALSRKKGDQVLEDEHEA